MVVLSIETVHRDSISTSMDIIDISSGSDNEMDDRQNNNPNSVLPGFLGTSHKQPFFEASASNSQHGRLKSQESGRAQIGSEAMSYSAGLPRGSHAKSHHDVNINNSAGPTENFTGHEFHPQIKHQRLGSQSGNVFQVENDSGTISSDDNTGFRRLPHSLLPGPEVDIYGGSRLNRNDEDKNRRAKASLGSASSLYQESVHMGIDSKLGLGGVGNNVGKMIDEQRFQHHEDPHVPKLDKRFLPASFLNTMSRTESKTSTVENGIAGPRYDVHGKYNNENSADRAFYMGDSYGNGNDDDVTIYKVAKQRVLPPTFTTSGRHVTGTNPANLSGVPQYTGGEEMQAQYDETPIYQAALQDLSQPKVEADVPDGVLTVSLLRHQKIALSWMVQKETAGPNCLGGFLADDQGLGKTVSTIALIQMQRPRQPEATSSNLQSKKFEPLNLDEDDDILSELEKTMQNSEVIEKTWENTSMEASSCKGRPAAGTLIVCPASVLRQWSRELDEKVTQQAKLSILIYHGSNRTRDPIDLASYDVVLTTYAIVSNEVPKQPLADDDGEERNMEKYGLEPSTNKKRKKASNAGKKVKKRKKGMDGSIDYESGPLARVVWFRVVLDEAQTIKNHRTQVARACCGLRAKRRWCLSGTPIQNAIDDLYSYFRFLRYDPYAVYKSFCTSIKYPISRNLINGYKKLQAVLKAIMLRRTKDTLIEGKPILLLPPKSICLKKVDFSSEERGFYTSLEADSRSQFKKYAEAGTLSQNYANILLLLLRLRQACDHPLLAEGFRSHSTGKASLEMARYLPREMLTNLSKLLEPSLAICGVCRDPPEDAVVTMCGHVFCYQCVSDRLAGDDNFCPADECKDQLGPESTFSRATLLSCISNEPADNNSNGASFSRTNDEVAHGQNTGSSSKIKAVLEILHSVCKVKNPTCTINSNEWNGTPFSPETINDSKLSVGSSAIESQLPDKAIVFSQWTSMLDLLEISLRNSCITFRRLDGTMSLASRDKAVKDFITNPEVAVMIMSLKAGNLGLNMVAANHVILLDLWWNPTTEDQAIDRAHRIGQTRPVTVSRLTVKDTVEDRILALQEEKRKMVSSAFGEDHTGGSATRLTVEDLTYLFMGGSL